MRKTREEKAITLIALIITIVVLLILAVVAINSVTGDGIIQHATNARDDYEKAQAEEESILSYYTDYLDSQGNMGPWRREGDKIINSNTKVELQIGDTVEYSAIAEVTNEEKLLYKSEEGKCGITGGQEFDARNYTGTWQVLGTENGRILLMSSLSIGDYSLYERVGYQYGPEELNNICNIYGHGEGAESARCITIEDINKITGYVPSPEVYGKDGIREYNLEVTYTKENGVIKYSSDNGSGTSSCITFTYFNGKEWISLNEGDSVTLKSNTYFYYPATLSTTAGELINPSKQMGVLFGDDSYWLASQNISTSEGSARYSLRFVYEKSVCNGNPMSSSVDGDINNDVMTYGIRPLVVLNEEVNLEPDGNNNWKIQ